MTKIFFVFRRLKINFPCFFYKQYLIKQHQAQAQIWSKISRWVENSMTVTKSIRQWMALLTASYRHPPPPPHFFYKKILIPPFYDFSKFSTPYKQGGFTLWSCCSKKQWKLQSKYKRYYYIVKMWKRTKVELLIYLKSPLLSIDSEVSAQVICANFLVFCFSRLKYKFANKGKQRIILKISKYIHFSRILTFHAYYTDA